VCFKEGVIRHQASGGGMAEIFEGSASQVSTTKDEAFLLLIA
jgi:hypothetical protein